VILGKAISLARPKGLDLVQGKRPLQQHEGCVRSVRSFTGPLWCCKVAKKEGGVDEGELLLYGSNIGEAEVFVHLF
jgi:hypothetical protein